MECSAYLHNIVSGCWELKRKFRLKLELEPIFIKIKDDKFCTTVGSRCREHSFNREP